MYFQITFISFATIFYFIFIKCVFFIFRKLLRLLIDNLSEKDPGTQVVVLHILTEIFQNQEMQQCWCNFVELLTLRVLTAHSDGTREVINYLIFNFAITIFIFKKYYITIMIEF